MTGQYRAGETIGELPTLVALSIGAVDLEWLLPLTRLRSFSSGLGAIAHIDLLPRIGALEQVSLFQSRLLRDVSVLGELEHLQHLSLEAMSPITTLPSFRRCLELRRIDLVSMHGITDLQPVADAPNLEYLLLIAMTKLDPEALRPLIGHPTLRGGTWGLGSPKKNFAAQDLLPVGDEPPYA